MSDKKKDKSLIILSPGFPRDETDSTCLPAQQLFIKSLNNKFQEIEIIVLTFQYPYTRSLYLWNQNMVIPFNGRNKNKISRLSVWIRVWLALKKLKKERNIIGLFSFWCTECALIGKHFGEFYQIKHYCWISGQDARRENKFVAFIRPQPAMLVAMSAFLAQEFNKNHHIYPQHIIPNGISPDLFAAPVPEKNVDILGVGSLIGLKQYDLFIAIIKEITHHLPGINTLICGKGPEENNLKALISGFNLETNVSLTGELPHQEVLRLMQRSKILLHTSSYEGFSSVCLEALYAGAHVISFCDPVTTKIKHWHIVNTKEEMLEKTLEILLSEHVDYEPVLAYSMNDSAKAIMELYGI